MRESGPILVPLDGSELAEGALPYAAALAKALRCEIVLMTAWEGVESELGAQFPSMALEIQQKADAHYSQYLDGLRQRAGGAGVQAMIRAGDAGDEILRAAEETQSRMIVVATHGRSGIGRWLYGSTASHVLRHATAPVVAVGPHALEHPRQTVELKHIMVPLDGSELSERALPAGQALAKVLGGRLSLVRAVNWAVQSYPYTLPDAYVPQVDEELEAGAKAYLRRKEDEVKDVERAAFVVRGSSSQGLLDFVEKEAVDLVVMTTHARAGLARAALGSVADRMIQGTAPVMFIRPD
jgi:nucleotide-binding universal stress UspA family protein